MAAVMALSGVFLAVSDSVSATGEDLTGYGNANEIEIAPGYSWSYTATFPSDLTPGTVLDFAVNELNGNAVITPGTHSLTITIPDGFTPGKYNVVLEATHTPTGQVGHQWIRITVNNALALDYDGCLTEIVQGTSQSITLSSTGGIGTVSWQTVGSLPAGLTLTGNVISGTPTTIGENVVQVQAVSSRGETKDLEITFTVFNKIVGGDEQTITSLGTYATSNAIVQDGTDLGVTWEVTTGTLPAGFSIDPSTGVVSGTYSGTDAGSVTLTLTGTAAHGPEQTATKQLTIQYEPKVTVSGSNSVLTYTGNTADKTFDLTLSGNTSAVTWDPVSVTGVSIEGNKVKVSGSAAVTDGTTVEITGQTAYGQALEHSFNLVVEDTLTITGPESLAATAGQSATSTAFTINGGSGNEVQITDNGGYASGLAYNSESNTLTISYPTAHAASDITLTVTSDAGQTATATISVQVFSSMGFTSVPGAAGIYAYLED